MTNRPIARPLVAALIAMALFAFVSGGFPLGPLALTGALTFVIVFALQTLTRQRVPAHR